MLINNYLQSFKLAMQKLEDYGLVQSLDDLTEVRSETTIYLCIKVILIDLSEFYIKEYLSVSEKLKQLRIEIKAKKYPNDSEISN